MQKVILAVVHDTSVRTELIQALRGQDYLVIAVPDAAMALDVALHTPIALVILDLALQYPDGSAFCDQLCASAKMVHIPLLMLVASMEESVLMRQRGLHVDDFLLKPFRRDELRERVHGLLRSGRHLQKVLLLVERSADSREATVSRLQEEGYIVLATPDAAMALDLARDNTVSLVILDLISLHLDGPELCRQLRASAVTAAIPY